jgi:hypothetical protein
MLKTFPRRFPTRNSWVRFPRESALGICLRGDTLAKPSAMRITASPGFIASEKKRRSEI